MLECNDWYVPRCGPGCESLSPAASPGVTSHFDSHDILPQPRYPQGHRQLCGLPRQRRIRWTASAVFLHFPNSRNTPPCSCSGGLGTRGSRGFNCCRSTERRQRHSKAVIGGSAAAAGPARRTTRPGSGADWCTGRWPSPAKSHLGTMCVAVASTTTIVEDLISFSRHFNWYDYYRCNGLNHHNISWRGDNPWTFGQAASASLCRTRRGLCIPFRRRMPRHKLGELRLMGRPDSSNFACHWWDMQIT